MPAFSMFLCPVKFKVLTFFPLSSGEMVFLWFQIKQFHDKEIEDLFERRAMIVNGSGRRTSKCRCKFKGR